MTFCHTSTSADRLCFVETTSATFVFALSVFSMIYFFYSHRRNIRERRVFLKNFFHMFIMFSLFMATSSSLLYYVVLLKERGETLIHFHVFNKLTLMVSWAVFFGVMFAECRFKGAISTFSAACSFFTFIIFAMQVYNFTSRRAHYPDFYRGPIVAILVFNTCLLLLQNVFFVFDFAYQSSAYNPLYEEDTEVETAFHRTIRKMSKLLPFLWPKKDIILQIMMIVAFSCLFLGRVINIFVPLKYKAIVDALTETQDHQIKFAWKEVLIFVFLRFLQGSVGLVASAQNLLWIRVGQYTTKEVSVKIFAHLHSLSLHYHLNRKTGEILRIIDRGTSSIVNLLNAIIFNVIPTLIDIAIASVFFVILFDMWFGFIVFTTMTAYIAFTVVITEWRIKFRRKMNEADNKVNAKAVDSLLNFETVKYYGAENFETKTYAKYVGKFQKADLKSQASLYVLNTAQNTAITLGLLASCLLCVSEVYQRNLSVGDFVLLLTYITQLYVPLNFFGNFYRAIQQSFIDMEKMMDLFNVQPDIVDIAGAKPLKCDKGVIKFNHVSFHYANHDYSLKDFTFTIPSGHTVAIVGPSGSGKTTLLRLLFRFYDVQEGTITIDGQDIDKVQASSLRHAIGIVPQDTVLFNDTVRYNIRYGKIDATDEEVEEAAKAAQIHDKILSFPDGYNTRVGERGLRLSGGETQRMAIARTILKNPKIIVLDEATSALDTNTERQIQASLNEITQNKTTLIIAHRLSTIVHANTIIVLQEGVIAETGNHQELLERNGVYASLWKKQLAEK